MEELVFWHGIPSNENTEVLMEQVRKFNQEQPEIKVKLQCYGAADLAEGEIIKAVVNDDSNSPAMLWYGPQLTGRLASSDILVPVEKFIAEDDSIVDSIYDELLATGIYKDRLTTLPFDANNLGVFYNKEYFEQAGIEEMPTDWSEFLEVAQQVQQNSEAQYAFLLPYGIKEWVVWVWETFLWQAGGEILTDAGRLAFNSQAGIEALQYWADLKDKYRVAELSRPEAGHNVNRLKKGRVAMQIVGSWVIPELEACDLNYGTFMLPENERQATALGGENLYIFKTNPQKEQAAWEFAKYILSDDFQIEYTKQTGYLPVTESALNNSEYQQFLTDNPTIKSFADQLESGFTRPTNYEYSTSISPALGRAIQKVLDRAASPKEALREAEKKVKQNTILK